MIIVKGKPLTVTRIYDYVYYKYIYYIHNLLRSKLYRPYQKYLMKSIRKKDKIRVLFVIAELGSWKTESLYLSMVSHPRFEPVLGVTTSQEVPGSKQPLINYIIDKGYSYVDLDESSNSIESIDPDIKFYYKPYSGSYPRGIYFDHHMKSVVCFISYAFNMAGSIHGFIQDIHENSWKCFMENELVIETAKKFKNIYTGNYIVTGLPIQDFLLRDKSCYPNPWSACGNKKKIIYAPHHSFKGTNGTFIEYATFLENGEFMLQMSRKYADKVQIAFKPHPTLYPKLLKVWGKERTDAYYNEWRAMENGQVELGEYMGLFKYSDAMIHDCCSFIAEYLFTKNPVMFLEDRPHSHEELRLGLFGGAAHDVHYLGYCHKDIENFIIDVIKGDDPMKSKREKFCNEFLLPPNGQTACENIIDAILGQGAYKDVK